MQKVVLEVEYVSLTSPLPARIEACQAVDQLPVDQGEARCQLVYLPGYRSLAWSQQGF